ncbi:MAG: electron transport complex subunit RsxA [Lachnospiraceae bacterium]|nr:electron transport complex subunit RsxA [Lachnospiraceae bacterium]
MRDLLIIILASSLINNIILSQFLGLCPFMGTSKKIGNAAGMGVLVIFVITLVSAAGSAINLYVLKPFGISYLQTLIYIIVIMILVKLIDLIIKKFFQKINEKVGDYLPILATNCIVLGTVIINTRADYDVLTGTVNGFALALGFALVLIIFAGIRERIEYSDIPESFKGVPISLVIAGLMAMAFFGFTFL